MNYLFSRIKRGFSRRRIRNSKKKRLKGKHHQEQVDLNLAGLEIHLFRKSKIDTPNEITIVVPRAEIRKRCLNEDCSQFEKEIILNSITIVSAPRHPLAAPTTNDKNSMEYREYNKSQKREKP